MSNIKCKFKIKMTEESRGMVENSVEIVKIRLIMSKHKSMNNEYKDEDLRETFLNVQNNFKNYCNYFKVSLKSQKRVPVQFEKKGKMLNVERCNFSK